MSEEIRVNRPVNAPRMDNGAPSGQGPVQGGSSKTPWFVLGAVVVVLLVVGVLFRQQLFGMKKGGEVAGVTAGTTEYQAIFLTNGQVYFGKVSDVQKEFLTLKDIYYLQVVQPPLQGQGTPEAQGQNAAAQQPQISLVKLGNELHGPTDEMKINRDQVLFYEDLKTDSQVVKAIKDYKAAPAK